LRRRSSVSSGGAIFRDDDVFFFAGPGGGFLAADFFVAADFFKSGTLRDVRPACGGIFTVVVFATPARCRVEGALVKQAFICARRKAD
jgi:hypothetical protein